MQHILRNVAKRIKHEVYWFHQRIVWTNTLREERMLRLSHGCLA